MRINSVNTNLSFSRNLTEAEIPEYIKTLQDAKKLVGQTGHSIFIMPSACLPQTEKFNSGIGHLSSDIANDYVKFLKTYFGINVIEDLPVGQVPKENGFYCAYRGSTLSLGNHQINPELLTGKEFGEILSAADIQEIANGNTEKTKQTLANFDNVMDNNGTQNNILKKAFSNFKKLDDTSEIKTKYKNFISANDDWLSIPRASEPDMDFFKFKQFLADEHLKIAKDKLNNIGVKLCGDVPIGFSNEEIVAFPNAFKKGEYIGTNSWKTPSLNFDEIFNPSSDAYKLLKRKIQLNAKRYDMLRIDAAWLYANPNIITKSGSYKKDLGEQLLSQIEGWIKEVKGENFDLRNVFYEFEAGINDFSSFKNGDFIPAIKHRLKAYTSQYMHNAPDEWGYNKGFLNRGLTPDEFILGVGNHDSQALKSIANNVSEEISKGQFVNHKISAIPTLSEIFNVAKSILEDPVEFAKYKLADIMNAKHNYIFYMDAFGREERFDPQWKKFVTDAREAYRYKVPTDFRQEYQKAIQSGFGYNPMDALEKVFIAKGLNYKYPELFSKIVKFKEILINPKPYTELEKFSGSSKSLLPFLFCGVGILSIASAIKFFDSHKSKHTN